MEQPQDSISLSRGDDPIAEDDTVLLAKFDKFLDETDQKNKKNKAKATTKKTTVVVEEKKEDDEEDDTATTSTVATAEDAPLTPEKTTTTTAEPKRNTTAATLDLDRALGSSEKKKKEDAEVVGLLTPQGLSNDKGDKKDQKKDSTTTSFEDFLLQQGQQRRSIQHQLNVRHTNIAALHTRLEALQRELALEQQSVEQLQDQALHLDKDELERLEQRRVELLHTTIPKEEGPLQQQRLEELSLITADQPQQHDHMNEATENAWATLERLMPQCSPPS